MVAYYRLSELGYTLAPGMHVLPPEAFEPVAAATALLNDAEARAAEIVDQAELVYQRRHQEGYENGLAQARVESVERLLQENATLDAGLREVEAEMARIVAACVRKLVDGFDDFTRAESVVRGALKQMRREKRSELRVSSAQYMALRSSVERIIADFPEVELIDVVEDAALTSPQIVLESSIGRVEGEFGASLEELESIIRSVAKAPVDGHAAAA